MVHPLILLVVHPLLLVVHPLLLLVVHTLILLVVHSLLLVVHPLLLLLVVHPLLLVVPPLAPRLERTPQASRSGKPAVLLTRVHPPRVAVRKDFGHPVHIAARSRLVPTASLWQEVNG